MTFGVILRLGKPVVPTAVTFGVVLLDWLEPTEPAAAVTLGVLLGLS